MLRIEGDIYVSRSAGSMIFECQRFEIEDVGLKGMQDTEAKVLLVCTSYEAAHLLSEHG